MVWFGLSDEMVGWWCGNEGVIFDFISRCLTKL
jgi:hypothetical protein